MRVVKLCMLFVVIVDSRDLDARLVPDVNTGRPFRQYKKYRENDQQSSYIRTREGQEKMQKKMKI